MTLELLPGEFSVCKLEAPLAVLPAGLCFLANTDQEYSLVCETADVPATGVNAREDGWCAMRVSGQLDFSLIGILAGISQTLAAARVGIFVVSTYDTDYILLKERDLDRALDALSAAGYEIA